jgi:hypothetical protein
LVSLINKNALDIDCRATVYALMIGELSIAN